MVVDNPSCIFCSEECHHDLQMVVADKPSWTSSHEKHKHGMTNLVTLPRCWKATMGKIWTRVTMVLAFPCHRSGSGSWTCIYRRLLLTSPAPDQARETLMQQRMANRGHTRRRKRCTASMRGISTICPDARWARAQGIIWHSQTSSGEMCLSSMCAKFACECGVQKLANLRGAR